MGWTNFPVLDFVAEKTATKHSPKNLPHIAALGENKPVRLMYLDECKDQNTNAVSLTALVVDESRYIEFRRLFFKSLEKIVCAKPNTYGPIPELHGSKFLPNATDRERIDIQKAIFSVVKEVGARVYRCGYYRDGEFPPGMDTEENLLSLAFLGIQFQTQVEYERELILPIMDGVSVDISKLVGSSNHSTQGHLALGLPKGFLSIENYQNIADPVVSDSRFSVGTQCVDVVSYALHCKHWFELGLPKSEYKQQVVEAVNELGCCIRANEVVKMKMVRSS